MLLEGEIFDSALDAHILATWLRANVYVRTIGAATWMLHFITFYYEKGIGSYNV